MGKETVKMEIGSERMGREQEEREGKLNEGGNKEENNVLNDLNVTN